MSVRTFMISFLDGLTWARIFGDLRIPGCQIGSSRMSLKTCSRLKKVARSMKESD